MPKGVNSLTKSERIYRRKEISDMFREGESFFLPNFKCVYRLGDATTDNEVDGVALRMMVSVSKRYHKRAVKRNRVKRLIREAFRLNKNYAMELLGDVRVDICYIYIGKEELSYHAVEDEIRKSFKKIKKISDINTISIN